MEPTQLSELGQAGHDHLDVNRWCVMSEVNQTLRLRPERLGTDIARAPIGDNRRIEGRFVEFVLEQ